eukprot:3534041-Rhodomonas_salina.1
MRAAAAVAFAVASDKQRGLPSSTSAAAAHAGPRHIAPTSPAMEWGCNESLLPPPCLPPSV